MTMKQIRFIHAADLHLDSPMIGLSHLSKEIFERLKESTFTALKKVTDAAIQNNVDFVVLAGDLFNEEDRSIRAQTRLRKEMERLKVQNISVYIIHGNHDHLNGEWVHLDMPDNVHIFSEKVEVKRFEKPGLSVHLYGFSYETKHVADNHLIEYRKKNDADFHIGLLHGHYEGESEHGKYASFRINDLLSKGFDYWALGHIHKREILHQNPPIVYPGNIQGRNRKETGEKGCYFVTLSSAATKLDFISTADIIWENAVIDGSEVNSFQELYFLCQKTLENRRTLAKGVLLSISLINIDLTEKELDSIRNGELLQVLQEDEKDQDFFVWPIGIEFKQSVLIERSLLERESDFYVDLFRQADCLDNLTNSIQPLYGHPAFAKFVQPLSEKEKFELQQDALQLLIRLLH